MEQAVGSVAAGLGILTRYLLALLPPVATVLGLVLVVRGIWAFDPRIGAIVLGLVLLRVPARFRVEARR